MVDREKRHVLGADAIIEGMLDEVMIVDTNGKILQVNSEFERGTGWRREEVIGKAIIELGITSKEEEETPVLLLNNDVTLSPDALCLLIDEAERCPDVGLVSPKIYL